MSRVDRHEHIGKGCIGLEPFRRLLNDPRFDHLPMILETEKSEWREKGKVVIDPLDEMNLNTLRSLPERSRPKVRLTIRRASAETGSSLGSGYRKRSSRCRHESGCTVRRIASWSSVLTSSDQWVAVHASDRTRFSEILRLALCASTCQSDSPNTSASNLNSFAPFCQASLGSPALMQVCAANSAASHFHSTATCGRQQPAAPPPIRRSARAARRPLREMSSTGSIGPSTESSRSTSLHSAALSGGKSRVRDRGGHRAALDDFDERQIRFGITDAASQIPLMRRVTNAPARKPGPRDWGLGLDQGLGSLSAPMARAMAARARAQQARPRVVIEQRHQSSRSCERAERRRQVADDRVLVAGHIARVAVLQHARIRGAKRLRGAHHRHRRSSAARVFGRCLEQRHQAVGIEPLARAESPCDRAVAAVGAF